MLLDVELNCERGIDEWGRSSPLDIHSLFLEESIAYLYRANTYKILLESISFQESKILYPVLTLGSLIHRIDRD